MQKTEIQDRIHTFLAENFARTGEIRNDELLLGNVIDSTGVMELVMFLQDQFKITVGDDDITNENIGSLDNATEYVARKLGVGV